MALYDWIAERASPDAALGYIDRLENYFRGLEYASERGTLRNDIREGLRTVGFERRVTIPFNVNAQEVLFLAYFMAAKIGRKPYRNTEIVIVVLHYNSKSETSHRFCPTY